MPVDNQLISVTCIKTSFNEEYKTADLRQTRETCPFNLYGRIVSKSKKGCAYYYPLLSQKPNKTLLWENSRKSLEKEW